MENEHEEPSSVGKIAMKWGLIAGVLFIALGMIYEFAGLSGESWVGWTNLIPLAVLIFLAHKAFKDSGNGFMSYGQGLGTGTLLSLISSIVSGIFTYIYLSFVDDSMIKQIMDKTYQQWEEQGMSDAQIEQAEKFVTIMISPSGLVITGILFSVFFGFLISLIVSAITKNSEPEFY